MSEGTAWELISKAQHLHFERGDMIVLTTHRHLHPDDAARIREEIGKLSEGIQVMVVEPEVELAKMAAAVVG